ncbi:MAG: DUF2461 domain-containing protein [Cytophagales bacterium]|nr:DUF2461 domain-containing protein [Cytophagales bacterium]
MHHLLDFLKKLKDHNTKEWMEENRDSYLQARGELLDFTERLIQGMGAFDPELLNLDPKKSVFRLHRDVRFSKNKEPYKTNFGIFLAPGGKNSGNAGYYVHLQPGGKSFLGGGIYMPDADVLRKVRQEIDYNGEALEEIVKDKNFRRVYSEFDGERLKTAPKGYPKDHPRIEWLRLKHYIFFHNVSDDQVKSVNFAQFTVGQLKALKPFVDFLNTAIV